jgi:dCTP deaminase
VTREGSTILLILVYTNESFSIKSDAKLMALVQGKSGLARLGLSVHITAPIIHPGFGEKNKPEPIMLEIYNHGHLTIKIYPGMPICQYLFEQVLGSYINTSIKGFAAGQPHGKKKAA